MMTVISIVFAVCFLLCWLAVLRFDIQMFQQNSYKPDRYRNWFCQHLFGHRRWMLFLLFALVWNKYLVMAAAAFMLLHAYLEYKTKYKIKIVYTARVRRLYAAVLIPGIAVLTAIYLLLGPYMAFYAAVAVLIASKLLVLLGNFINSPLENAIARWYYKDASRKLAQHSDLIVIGVTGSYGKTSTKNYLYRILSEKYNTLVTPGNYNTTMGVVRTIREQLKPYHQVFIVEMGAKQVGDIKEICNLVHPAIGIVTSVGDMHLETFKTRENIQRTKFELIRSLPADGLGVINMDSEGIAEYADIPDNCKIVRYGVKAFEADYYAEDIKFTHRGTDFTVLSEGRRTSMHTSLLGECNILNILGALAVADKLDVETSRQQMAVAKLQQVEHRLYVSRRGGLTILDDAYNSNPDGARMALDVLKGLELPEGGRRIVVTPGFVELGDRQEDACFEFGRQIAEAADRLVIVNRLNKNAILSGAVKAGMRKGNIDCAQDLSEAAEIIKKIADVGDAILYENDLPDTFK